MTYKGSLNGKEIIYPIIPENNDLKTNKKDKVIF